LISIVYFMLNNVDLKVNKKTDINMNKNVSEFIDSHLRSEDIKKIFSSKDRKLTEIICVWRSHKLLVKWLLKIFSHLEKFLVANSSNSISTTAMISFYNKIYVVYKDNLVELTLDLIRQDRSGEVVDEDLLSESIEVFFFIIISYYLLLCFIFAIICS
jgi:hypothetical protein